MRALEFITGHVIYNPLYTDKYQLKTTLELLRLSWGPNILKCFLLRKWHLKVEGHFNPGLLTPSFNPGHFIHELFNTRHIN